MDEPPTKKPGRRPLNPDDPSVTVGVTLPSKQFDAYCRRAHRDAVSVPEIIRRDLRRRTAAPSEDPTDA